MGLPQTRMLVNETQFTLNFYKDGFAVDPSGTIKVSTIKSYLEDWTVDGVKDLDHYCIDYYCTDHEIIYRQYAVPENFPHPCATGDKDLMEVINKSSQVILACCRQFNIPLQPGWKTYILGKYKIKGISGCKIIKRPYNGYEICEVVDVTK